MSKTRYFLPVFIGAISAIMLLMECTSREIRDVKGRAMLNTAVGQSITAIQQNARYKFERAKELAEDPWGMMTTEEKFVLTERFDFSTASLKEIKAYYTMLSALRKGDMPPLWDKTVTVSPLR